MWNEALQDTLYGNEWIDFSHTDRYFKIEIAEDGLYRIPKSLIPANAEGIEARKFKLMHLGEEVPMMASTEGMLSDNDYLQFYGLKNRSELDQFLFSEGQELLNPEYSLFTDTTAYFLTWSDTEDGLRFSEVDNDLTDLPAPEAYFTFTEKQVETANANKMAFKAGGVTLQKSYYDSGEGFGKRFNHNQDYSHTFSLEGITDDQAPFLDIRFAGSNHTYHQQTVLVNGEELTNTPVAYYAFKNFQYPLPNLSENSTIKVDAHPYVSTTTQTSYLTLGTISIDYSRNFDFGNRNSFRFNIDASNTKKYLEITNFNGSENVVLYDLTNHIFINALVEDGTIRVILPPSGTTRDLLLVSENAAINTVQQGTLTEFIDYSSDDSEFIIISNPLLYYDEAGVNQIQRYADFRSQSYETSVVDIDQLYDQFAYGIKRNPISIRNFANFTKKHNSNATYFFLVGNAREYHQIRTTENLTNSAFYLPTYGRPGGDNLLVSNSSASAKPLFALGRLTAQSANDISVYLDKVIEAEQALTNPQTIEDRLWMKNILHLGGGSTDGEQSTIKHYLDGMADTLQNSMYGAIPHSYFKTSSDVITESPRTSISKIVKEGVSIFQFFGHASANGFDFPIDSPSEFNNQGKYFLLISNGCFSGNCHLSSNGIGELFLFEPNKGAILFLASNGYGYISALGVLTTKVFNLQGNEMYNESFARILQAAILENNSEINTGYAGLNLLSQQYTLQGDPAVKLYPHPTPDLTIDNTSVQVTPSLVNVKLDSFEVAFTVANIGKYLPDSSNIHLKFEYANGEIGYEYKKRIQTPKSTQKVSLKVPLNDRDKIIGLNKIYLEVDADNEIDEQPLTAETNNNLRNNSGELGYDVLIVSNDLIPLYPKEYSIVNNPDVELKASTVNAFLDAQDFIIQIDTVATFDSPLFTQETINQIGGVIKWKPSIPLENDKVYYWRTSPISEDNQEYRWNSSSFLFLENVSGGWNQSHYDQFADDDYTYMQQSIYNKFQYIEEANEVVLENTVAFYQNGPLIKRPCILLNSVPVGCSYGDFGVNNGIKLYVLDSVTIDPILNYHQYTYPRPYYQFKTTTYEDRQEVINFLNDSIDVGNYIALVTVQRTENHSYYPEEWAADSLISGVNLFSVLEEAGAQNVRTLETTGSVPYTLFYKKGYPNAIGGEEFAPIDGTLGSIYNPTGYYDRGSVLSPLIGPAQDWNIFTWETEEEVEDFEVHKFNIYGLKHNGTRDTLFTEVTEMETNLSSIEANTYPKIQLEWLSRDSVLRTPPQLANWRVLYQGVPEVALNPQAAYEITADTVQQGQTFNLKVGIENISDYNMDSLLVKYIIKDDNSSNTINNRIAPVEAGQSIVANLDVNTRDFNKITSLLIDVNPDEDQVEETHINNTGQTHFYVTRDNQNPIMDVTFDGVHILNGDIVSSTPQIVMSFTDENKYIAMEDTAQFRLSLKYPDNTTKRVYFNQADVLFIPADSDNLAEENKAVIEYSPELVQDGTYTLKLEGQDPSGNISGEVAYTIEFEVITKSMISNILNYPNPFSNSTRFVYTLTGNETPAYFKIQIMTVSGRIVREITQNELGDMKIGTHQTDFVWDGTDEFGDKLANGVYLYRVIAKNAKGEDIEQYTTDADGFFTQGFGKMVITR